MTTKTTTKRKNAKPAHGANGNRVEAFLGTFPAGANDPPPPTAAPAIDRAAAVAALGEAIGAKLGERDAREAEVADAKAKLRDAQAALAGIGGELAELLAALSTVVGGGHVDKLPFAGTPAGVVAAAAAGREPAPSAPRLVWQTSELDRDHVEWFATNTAGIQDDPDVDADFVVNERVGDGGAAAYAVDMSCDHLMPIRIPGPFATLDAAKAWCEARNAELSSPAAREQMPELFEGSAAELVEGEGDPANLLSAERQQEHVPADDDEPGRAEPYNPGDRVKWNGTAPCPGARDTGTVKLIGLGADRHEVEVEWDAPKKAVRVRGWVDAAHVTSDASDPPADRPLKVGDRVQWCSPEVGQGSPDKFGRVVATTTHGDAPAHVEWDRQPGERKPGRCWVRADQVRLVEPAAIAPTANAPGGPPACNEVTAPANDVGPGATAQARMPRGKYKSIDADVADVLRRATAEGNALRLPDEQLDRKLYERVAKALALLGGKWNKRSRVHLFPSADAVAELMAGLDAGKLLDRKQTFQFFETPAELARRMVELAEIGVGMRVLEPSAGRGAIARAVAASGRDARLHLVELDPAHIDLLTELRPELVARGVLSVTIHRELDFLAYAPGEEFDRVVMNPPFTRGQDIDHVRHAFDLLAPGGRLVAVMSAGAFNWGDGKARAFREWLNGEDGFYEALREDLPHGTFRESGTDVAAKLLVLDKPKAKAVAPPAAFDEDPPIFEPADVRATEAELFAADCRKAMDRPAAAPPVIKHVVGDRPGADPQRPCVVVGERTVRGVNCLVLAPLIPLHAWKGPTYTRHRGSGADRIRAGFLDGVVVKLKKFDFVVGGDVFHVRVGKGGRS